MASNEANKSTLGLTPKEIALYVGIPVATVCVAGGLYYYFRRSGSAPSLPEKSLSDISSAGTSETLLSPIEDESSDKSPLQMADAAKSRGNKFFKAMKYDKAIECYTRALELCPAGNVAEISTFYQNRAAAYEQQKSWKEVVEDSTKAIELNPKYSKALARRARAYEALDEKIKCLEDVTAVCLLEGFQNQQCMLLADRILKAIGKEKAGHYFKERPATLPSGVFVRSYLDSFNEDILGNAKFTDEQKSSSSYYKAVQNMRSNKFDDVLSLCSKEIESNGSHASWATLARGTMYTLMCSIDNAMKDFDSVIQLDNPEFNKLKVDALIKRGSLKMQVGSDSDCFADFDTAVSVDRENPNIYHHRGQLYFLTDRLDEAQKDFEKAIALDPNFVAPRLQLGYCLCKLAMQLMSPSKMQEANEVLDETTKKFPQSPEAWSLYGQLLQDQQQLAQASEKLEKSIELAPGNPTTYVYKALLLLQWKQDLEAASKLIRRAIELDDKCDFAYETLATLEVQKGNSDEAIRLFERAVDLVRTEAEMANTFSLLEAARAQAKVTKQYGIKIPTALV